MGVDAAFEASAQFAEGGDPGMGPFDDPAVRAEAIIAFDALARDSDLDAAAAQMSAATFVVIALVGMKPVGPAAGFAQAPWHRGQRIDEILEDHGVMPVGPRDAKDQWDAMAVGDEVALAAEFAPVRRVGTCVGAPRGLGTLAPSRLARLKSSFPAPRSSASNRRCRRCQAPAACQSRSLRQQVMPLPKPSSWGRSSHGMPVRSTNKMPLSAARSDTRGRPAPVLLIFGRGRSGSMRCHSPPLMRACRVMPAISKRHAYETPIC